MGEGFVDDDLLRFRSIVVLSEEPASNQPCLECGEIGRRHVALVDFIVLAMERLADDANPIGVAVALNGQVAGDAYGLDTWQGGETAVNLAKESHLLLGFGIGFIRRCHLQSCEMRSVEAQVDVKEMIEALAQKSRADQEYDGDGELDDDEIRAHALPEASRGGAAAVAKPFANVLKRETQNWGQRHEPGGKQCNGSGEECDVHIEADVSKKGDVDGDGFRNQVSQNRHRPSRYEESGQASGGSQQQAFGDELAAEASGGGSKCSAHSDLATARF